MDIHQMQVKYDSTADRLLWQVRTRGGELFAVWLTRRMVVRLWPHYLKLMSDAAVAQVAPGATVLPEAQAMLAQVARDRPLPSANFSTRFDTTAIAQPLGSEPLLPVAIDMAPRAPAGGLVMKVREASGRSIEMQLSDDLATALMRLVEQALAGSEWGLSAGPAPGQQQATPPASALN